MSEFPERTASVCPVCLGPATARRELRGSEAWLVKTCPEHGQFETLIWRGSPELPDWSRPKTPFRGGPRLASGGLGCPWDCGLCPEHNQRTCTALIEVTARCDLGCPVCFASSGADASADPSLERIGHVLEQVWRQTGGCNLQISGGEPTMRADLPAIVEMARRVGFEFIQLNTNGLRLAAEPRLAASLAQAGLSSVFLQFDGPRPADHQALRGRDLTEVKDLAIHNAGLAWLGVVLVPTVRAGVNDGQLWATVRYGIERSPVVRGVHFQPMAFMGRYPKAPESSERFTLPEVMAGLEAQSGGQVKTAHFAPPCCEHSMCSCNASYVVNEDKSLTRLGGSAACDCSPQPAVRGALRSIQNTARQWSGQAEPFPAPPDDDPFSAFITRSRTHGFSISAMAFQDAWTLDLERLQGCCIHVAAADGRLVPFCAYNLSSMSGEAPHRQQGAWT